VRILVPSIVDPETFRGGAGTATRGLLGLLAGPPLRAALEVLPSVAPPGRLRHGARQAASVAAAMVSALPSKAMFQRAAGYARRVRRRLARRDYDLVLVNGADLLWVLDAIPAGVSIVACAHNLEYELYERQLEAVGVPRWLRPLVEADARKLRRFELDGLRRADGTLFLSSTEADRVRTYLDRRPPLVVPPVFHEPAYERTPRAPRQPVAVGFFANFEWWPNRDGMRWFLGEVHPACREAIRLHVFGRGSERFAGRAPGLTVHGPVGSASTVWEACDVLIAPIRAGAGVSVKVAEATYHGMPMVVTPRAVDGLPVAASAALVVAESAEAWIAALTGPGLAALVSATVTPAQRDVFGAEQHRHAVAAYLTDVAASAR
jgi:hypothetical protein